MKCRLMVLFLMVVVGGAAGCSKRQVNLDPDVPKELTVVSLHGNTSRQTEEQLVELNSVVRWMDSNLLRLLKRSGFNAVLVKDIEKYQKGTGNLLVVDVDRYNAGNRIARVFISFGAGASSLDLDYKFFDKDGAVLEEWKDGVGSSKGGTYCAQALNKNVVWKIANLLNSQYSPTVM